MNADDQQTPPDPLATFDGSQRAAFAAVADSLIPEAHGMPSAGDIVDETRLRFVLRARPDLIEPFQAALGYRVGDDPAPASRRSNATNRTTMQRCCSWSLAATTRTRTFGTGSVIPARSPRQ